MNRSNARYTVPLILIALALAVNLHGLAADSLWGDEIFTASFAGRSLLEVIRWTAEDIHPPLYYLVAGAFTALTIPLGTTADPAQVSDWLWRFPSVIAVVLTGAVTYRLAAHLSRLTRHSSRFIPGAAFLLFCLAPIAVKYAQEARMHALFMCFSALSTWLLWRALARPGRWFPWLAFALATVANIYTMYFGFLILAAQAGFVIFTLYALRFTNHAAASPPTSPRFLSQSPPTSILSGFTAAVAVAFLLYLPWWPVLWGILGRRAAVGAIEGGVGDPLEFMQGVIRALGPLPEPVAWGFLGLFMLGLVFLARRSWPLAGFATLWLALPVLLPIFLGDPRALQFRYAFILPIYLTIIAYTLAEAGTVLITGYRLPATKSRSYTVSASQPFSIYFLWLLVTLSFLATLTIYRQTKPNWREAAAYLSARTRPGDIILTGPLWDDGRFIGYYYRGAAQLLTPAALATNIQGHARSLRANGGRVWAVNRFAPGGAGAWENIEFSGVVVSEPQIVVYEPEVLVLGAIDLATQAVEAAYPWAAQAEGQGVLNPDPRTAKAAALKALGDTLVAAGRTQEAIEPYQTAVTIFPGWVNGFVALAETQEAAGNPQGAAEAYRQAVLFNSAWQGAAADEATRLVEAGQWAAALEKYHQIMED